MSKKLTFKDDYLPYYPIDYYLHNVLYLRDYRVEGNLIFIKAIDLGLNVNVDLIENKERFLSSLLSLMHAGENHEYVYSKECFKLE